MNLEKLTAGGHVEHVSTVTLAAGSVQTGSSEYPKEPKL